MLATSHGCEYNYPPLIEMLVEHGPYGLCAFAQEQYGYQALPDGYAGRCHLRVDVRRHLEKRGEFSELRPVDFSRHV